MNNKKFEKFIENFESIKMTSKEKDTMRHKLMDFADTYNPIVSPYHHISVLIRRGMAIAFVAVLSFGSFTNLVSQDTVPGDAFYPVKLAHEELKLAATFDTKKKISYEIRRTEKRIQEATELATESKLDSEKQESIAKNIKNQTKKVQDHIEEIKINDPEEALILNSELKSTIKVNTDALRKISTKKAKKEITKKNTSKTSETTVDVNITLEDGVITTSEIKEKTILSKEVSNNEDISGTTESAKIIEANETFLDIPADTVTLVDIEGDVKITYEDVEVSFAENLLESINQDVVEIQAFEEQVTQEIVQKEQDEIEEAEIEELEMLIPESLEKKEVTEDPISPKENKKDIIEIEKEIKNLKALTEIQEEINELKSDYPEDTYIEEVGFNEKALEAQVRALIKEQKHKQAFVVLETILRYYKEQSIIKQVTHDLGINLKDVEPVEIIALPEIQQVEDIAEVIPKETTEIVSDTLTPLSE